MGLWCKELGRLRWLGEELRVWNNEFLHCWLHSENCCVFQRDFVLVTSVYRSPALSWWKRFIFSFEALVYESWHTESFNSYILNVYIFLKSFGNAWKLKLTLRAIFEFRVLPPFRLSSKHLLFSEQLWLLAPTLLVFLVSWLYVFVEVHFMLNKLFVLLCTYYQIVFQYLCLWADASEAKHCLKCCKMVLLDAFFSLVIKTASVWWH